MDDYYTPIKYIDQLNPNWRQDKNLIHARISAKGKIRTQIIGHNSHQMLKVSKRYFAIHLIDQSNLEIAAIAFDSQVDEWYYNLEEGHVYVFSNFRVRLTDSEYRSDVLSPYQIIIGKDTTIYETGGSFPDIPRNYSQSDIVPIADLQCFDDGSTVGKFFADQQFCWTNCKSTLSLLTDILAVVLSMDDLLYRQTEKAGLQPMRHIYLMDKTKFVIVLTLWGWLAKEFHNKHNATIFLKAARLHEVNGGVQLCHTADCIMKTYPNMKAADNLWRWFHFEFNGKTRRCLSNL